jgi:hypothetical protein
MTTNQLFFMQYICNAWGNLLGSMMATIYFAANQQMYSSILSDTAYILHTIVCFLMFMSGISSLLAVWYQVSSIFWVCITFMINVIVLVLQYCYFSQVHDIPFNLLLFIISHLIVASFFVSFLFTNNPQISHNQHQLQYTQLNTIEIQTECCICNDVDVRENEENQAIYVQLRCQHCFHQDCIDRWFLQQVSQQQSRSCPLCRFEV